MVKKLFFEVEQLEDLNETQDSQFATAKILAFSSGKNRHDLICSEETLQRTAQSLDYKPIVYMVNELFQDFGTHSKEPGKSLISGFILPNTQEFSKLEDGRLGLYVTAKIWKKYADKFISFMKRDNGVKPVSVEMELFEFSDNSENPDYVNMDDFEYTAVCVLGTNVTEASPNANMTMLSFSKEQEEYNKAFHAEFGKYEGLDFTIPKKVKDNAKEGLELRKKLGRGSTSVGVSTAKYLISNEKASPEKVRHISKYWARHENDNLDDKESNGWVSWQIWGGHAGRSWSTKLVNQMNKRDDSNMSFFAEENNKEENFEMTDKEKEEVAVEEENPKAEEMSAEETAPEETNEDFAEEAKSDEESEDADDEETEDKPKEEEMSLDAYADVPAMLAMLDSETEQNKEMANMFATEKKVDWAIFAKMMFEKAKEIDEKQRAYMSENEELKKFKEDIEKEKFSFAVGQIISEVEKVLPQDKLDEIKEDVKNFSLETLDAFKNKTLALAFQYSKNDKNENKDKKNEVEFVVYGFPVDGSIKVDSPW